MSPSSGGALQEGKNSGASFQSWQPLYSSLSLIREGGGMMAKNQPSLPAKRAFVVQIHAEARVEQGHFKGRVEHLMSHQAIHFESLEELVAFIVRVTTGQRKP